MLETSFYKLCDAIDGIAPEDIPQKLTGYYPLKEDLSKAIDINGLEPLTPVVTYFSTNPYKADPIVSEERDYLETVAYCKQVLLKLPLVPDQA